MNHQIYKKNILVYQQKGDILITTLVFMGVFLIIASGLIGLVNQQRRLSRQWEAQSLAQQIAEAGANYYRWHLAHALQDYTDGTGQSSCYPCGPYVHEYHDPSGDLLGYFSLTITPPDPDYPGSTVVQIKSTGWTVNYPNTKKIVAVRLGVPSLARFTTVVNSNIDYGTGSETYGPVISNGGVRFDGVAHNIISSALQQYWYSGSWHDGVWTSQSHESQVFLAGKEFPVPAVDFTGFTQNLSTMEAAATSSGFFLPASGYQGYHLQFQTNNTFRYRTVETKTSDCNNQPTGGIGNYKTDWQTTTIPENGMIFVKDNVWIDGTIDHSRATVVAAKEPLDTGTADIFLNNNLLYTNKDGHDVIGLIAQNNVVIGLYSADNLEIDAVLIAKNGKRYRPDYGSSYECGSTVSRNQFTLYGTTISNLTPYMSSGSSGYANRAYVYDPNTLYAPPPYFPTSGKYEFISWEEMNR
ncbi:MAG: type II secretion system protein [Patescibacteria group bacterium]